MRIAGFKKQSLIDFPGNISSVVFTQGCNFRCGFCHNPELVLPEKFTSLYRESDMFAYLNRFKSMLDAVCITGGEPTVHNDLPEFIERIKRLGLKVKLDSNGTNPAMIKSLINSGVVDFIAMDIKHLLIFERYNDTVGGVMGNGMFDKVLMSVDFIANSGVDYEFRTTVVKGLHKKEDIVELKRRFGVRYKINNFNLDVVLNTEKSYTPFSEKEIEQMRSW